jgi:hypothetical protein
MRLEPIKFQKHPQMFNNHYTKTPFVIQGNGVFNIAVLFYINILFNLNRSHET